MDFDLSTDQIALADAAQEFLGDQCPPARIRSVHGTEIGWDPELWAAMVDLGWLGIAVPESDGGVGLGMVELGVVLEQAGRHLVPVPFLSTALAIDVARRAGDRDLVADLVGGRPACVAWTAASGQVRARDGVLHGRSDVVAFAPVADVALVIAHEGEDAGDAVYVVDLDAVGRPTRESAMDLSRPLGWCEFDATPARRLGGDDLAAYLTDLGATATALEMLGASSMAMELAVEYAKDRVQFGRPIGSFQAVKHRCADMLVDVEGIRSSAYWAAWCLGADDPDRSIAASTAKTWASDASKRVMASALQVHGGIGFTWEHDLHLYMKRSQLDQVSFGDAVWHRARLGGLLRAKVDAGTSVL